MLRPFFTIAALSAALTLGVTARADHPEEATVADLQQLQYDLANLDESLQRADTRDPRYSDLQQRVDSLRDEIGRLEDQIRAHQRDSGAGLGANQGEVETLRDHVRSVQRDIARANPAQAAAAWDATIPKGTEIELQLDQPLSSRTARSEDRVEATVARPVVESDRIVVPAGTRVEGTVGRVQPASRPARGGQLELSFDRLVFDDGRTVPLRSRIVSVGHDTRFNRRNAGIGAILGGVLGSVVGGKKGAIVGVLVGGAGGGFVADAGRNVELPAGAPLTLRLEQAVAMADWESR